MRKGLGALAAVRVGLLCRPLVPTRTAEAKQPETQVCSPTPYFCEKRIPMNWFLLQQLLWLGKRLMKADHTAVLPIKALAVVNET